MMAAFLLASPVQADLLLTATYSNWTQSGPLSFGLVAMPDEFSATWTTLASFDFEIDDGDLFLDYTFQALSSTQTAVDSIVLNGPLTITGTDIASSGTPNGGDFSYGYGTRTLSLVQVSVS
jgi:hypothetical protein